ncbi:MAG: hypothetical protein NVS2B16_11240 [Chloroflexota bacterium]
MRIAGVRLLDGTVLWADAGDLPVAPLDTVDVTTDDGMVAGTVFVAPEQFLRPPPHVEGVVVRRHPCGVDPAGWDADVYTGMPALGSTARTADLAGTVVGCDAVRGRVTLRAYDEETEVAVDAILRE